MCQPPGVTRLAGIAGALFVFVAARVAADATTRIDDEWNAATDVLASTYQVYPRLCHLEGEIGVLTPGASADVVVLDVDPLDGLAALAEPDAVIRHVIARGQPV